MKSADGARIGTPWWTRLLVYWALPWFAWLAWQWRIEGSPLTLLIVAVGLIVLCERYAFGYRVILLSDRLLYRDRGGLLGREMSLNRAGIVRSVYKRAINAESKPWERVEVEYRPSESERIQTHVLSLGSFRRVDIERILEWLPNVVRE
jgi:hypothetical protein